MSAALVLLVISLPLQDRAPVTTAQDAADFPITGAATTSSTSLDTMMTSLMQKWQLPGGELAVAKDGRLVFAHGYGYADRDSGTPVQPDSLFRIASVSKVFTSEAILTLVDRGLLNLDAPAFGLLSVQPPDGVVVDARIGTITVRQLIQHTGGFDRNVSGDPIWQVVPIATAMGVTPPADCPTIMRYMLGRALDFDPGTRYAYSNLGYCVLGQVIEAVSGMTYADYVRQSVMVPIGITRMALGHSLPAERLAGEVTYYDYPGAALVPSVFPNLPGLVPAPYGAFPMEGRGPIGGWIGSAVDLLKLSTAVGRRRDPPLLRSDTFTEMLERPAPVSIAAPKYTGLGWDVRSEASGFSFSKDGNIRGTISYLVSLANGWEWAVVFNSQPRDVVTFGREVDTDGSAAINALPGTPTGDLFVQFP
jgi:CubicO group peptidase (beta-lactamase class C family)